MVKSETWGEYFPTPPPKPKIRDLLLPLPQLSSLSPGFTRYCIFKIEVLSSYTRLSIYSFIDLHWEIYGANRKGKSN